MAGFASDEFDDRGVVFRGLHAHAWIEVVNSHGQWQRFDPTPAASLPLRTRSMGPGDTEAPPENLPTAEPAPALDDALATSTSHRVWWLLAGVTLVLAVTIAWRLRGWRSQGGNPQLAVLQRQSGNLLRLASSLGMYVGPATTLTEVAEALATRTGVDLSRHLQAHLAARFGGGPMPEPWPIAALRSAARQRSGVGEAARTRG